MAYHNFTEQHFRDRGWQHTQTSQKKQFQLDCDNMAQQLP
jgi:hypothetical protein